jgi:hypothetical protein
MLLHVDNTVSFSPGWDYCTYNPLPATCGDLATNVTKDPGVDALVWMVAAFPSGSSPGVNAFQVGLAGDLDNDYFDAYGICGPGPFEIPDATWPGAGAGTAVAYTSTVYSQLFKMYWFATLAPNIGASLSTTNYYGGDHHAEWADDSAPPVTDFCDLFGTVTWGGPGVLNCPGPLPGLGACCFTDEHCEDLLESTCLSESGTFEGEGTSCATFQCPQPNGACCFSDGHCAVETQASCAGDGGTWQGALTSCTPNPCGPNGACCFSDGHCEDLPESSCLSRHGTYEGEETSCATFQCPQPTGACCFHNGTCQRVTQAQCGTQGGTWQGANTTCNPNPCPQPTGACCFHNGSCTVLRQAQCASQGGAWQGMDVPCDPNPCPPPAGACCLAGGVCRLLTQAACAAQGGAWRGIDTSCAPNPCPQSTGACCFTDGRCFINTAAACEGICGAYQGDNMSCTPNPCISRPRAVHPRPATLASNPFAAMSGTGGSARSGGGRNAGGAMLLHADNSICYSAGADFCSLDPLPATCQDLVTNITRDPATETMVWMVAAFPAGSSPGVDAFQVGLAGDIPSDYFTAFGPCGQGSYEIPDPNWPGAGTGDAVALASTAFSQLFKMYWFAVAAPGVGSSMSTTNYYGGDPHAEWADDSRPPVVDICDLFGTVTWGGPGALNCPPPLVPIGACCFADGHCENFPQNDCSSQGGTYEGDGTSCATFQCPPPTGACCFSGGNCAVETRAACASDGGTWQGSLTSCIPNPCGATGACCFHDGHCVAGTQTDCALQGGAWRGAWTVCDPSPCPQPTGACCSPNLACDVLRYAECVAREGTWKGMDIPCDPNPCGPTGACCFAGGSCSIVTHGGCDQECGIYQGDGTSCDPNPCPPRQVEARAVTRGLPKSNPLDRGVASSPLRPGRNAGGAMLLHAENTVCYSIGTDYCSAYPLPATCQDLVTRITRDPGALTMIWMVGVFPPSSSPRVNAFQVGLGGDVTTDYIYASGVCGPGAFEVPDANWPGAGAGDAVAYTSTVTSTMFKMYWFAAGAPGIGSSMSTTNYYHANLRAEWADDSTPPVTDICSNFGTVSWGGAGGNNCPTVPVNGACCFANGTCRDLTEDACASQGGNFEGVGTACASFQCPEPVGACCAADGSCTVTTQANCAGSWQGAGTSCTPGLCSPPTSACCFSDGSCQNLSPDQCTAQGGIYHMDQMCDTFTCPPPLPTGACCVGQTCTITTEQDCTGTWKGPGTTCDNTACLATPVERRTWGSIKSLYR